MKMFKVSLKTDLFGPQQWQGFTLSQPAKDPADLLGYDGILWSAGRRSLNEVNFLGHGKNHGERVPFAGELRYPTEREKEKSWTQKYLWEC